MNLDNYINNPTGKIVMSILLGLGLSTIFRQICKGKKCREILSPPLTEIDNQTYKFNNKCYTFEKNPITCSNNKKTVRFA
jgi:hypothetical protein